jgi:two-component system alkaline phosphatase synthesis response regulator PhoP
MAKPKPENQQQKTPLVLIVDDDQPSLELLQAYLEDVDCETVSAQNGLQALKIIGKQAPDLVLLDIMMPKMSGFEVCKKKKTRPQNQRHPCDNGDRP